jgi:hypothetical protein
MSSFFLSFLLGTLMNLKRFLLKCIEFLFLFFQIIEEGTTGSVWYLHKHGDQPFEVPTEFPSFEALLKHQKQA